LSARVAGDSARSVAVSRETDVWATNAVRKGRAAAEGTLETHTRETVASFARLPFLGYRGHVDDDCDAGETGRGDGDGAAKIMHFGRFVVALLSLAVPCRRFRRTAHLEVSELEGHRVGGAGGAS